MEPSNPLLQYRWADKKYVPCYVYKTLLFPLVFIEHFCYLFMILAPLSFILLFSKQIIIGLISNIVSWIYYFLHFIEGVSYVQNWDDLVHDAYGNTDHFCGHISGYHPASFPSNNLKVSEYYFFTLISFSIV